MSVLEYLKRNLSDYFYAITFVLAISFVLSQSPAQVLSVHEIKSRPVLILDPGHGGSDGGTKTNDGVPESKINLEISRRLYDLMGLVGMNRILTRDSDISLDTEGSSVREKKNSDLRNRVKAVNERENGILISIHQNHFSQSRYSGPQVFFADTRDSEQFAEGMQQALNKTLGTPNPRVCKRAEGIYLMERIRNPGILIECGFLSNPEEAKNLQAPAYQKKLACIIVSATAQYLLGTAIG